ncbi:helix-turn-helix domain-containing protein [Paenibacillus glycinis]|uniref:Helix-turn-helix domain-containing protein n=1 Tax=Paenibacillus glycinis TaxID=2697035 RepID=A0ABW9XNB4_9BACL|nr:AraC family transcriptional regulator [Paenibacillus glycinis]NBD23894.1 helix-turn-helix domain-containing protein [Paenibacillus glycinis]
MRKIRPILYLRNGMNSLFARLVAGFLFIVLLLASLTVYAVSVSNRSVKQEVVKYNTSLLDNTRDSYEKHLNLIKQQMLLFFTSDEIMRLQQQPDNVDYPVIVREIARWTTVPYLYINNIVFYSKKDDLVLEKGTSTNAASMFNVFSASEEYPLAFWKAQFGAAEAIRILPAADMVNHIFRDSPQPLGELMPIIIEGVHNPDFYMIVLLDAAKMYEAFHQNVYKDFLIYDEHGKPIFGRAGDGEPFLTLEDLGATGANGSLIRDGKYYFANKGEGTGFTYVSRVPADRIAEQTRINLTLLAIILAAIAFSVLFSFLIAARIHNPLKKVIESIRQMNDEPPYRSTIKEFNIISGQIHGNRMLFRQLSFMNHLKAIRSHEPDAPKLEFAGKPFVFVLYHIQPHMGELRSSEVFQNWLYDLRMFIDSKLKPDFPDSLTFQIERDQMLSLVFTERRADVIAQLGQMKQAFDQDSEHGIVTMAVTSAHSASDHLTLAYEEAQELAGERLMTGETQLILERGSAPVALGFSPDQDKELEASLKAGNAAQLVALVQQHVAKWHRDVPTAASLVRFAESFAGKIRGAVTPFPLGPEETDALLGKTGERIGRCRTVKELGELLAEWTAKTAEAVREKKEEKHPITTQVVDYIHAHLADEIYLDVLAAKLKMSSGYLSSYFKAKTGMNIVDYINETRIAKAAGLLDDDRLKIREAAEAVGYRNITSFNRMFKKYMGLTPSEYRKRKDSN